jgi:hypothetical protein
MRADDSLGTLIAKIARGEEAVLQISLSELFAAPPATDADAVS